MLLQVNFLLSGRKLPWCFPEMSIQNFYNDVLLFTTILFSFCSVNFKKINVVRKNIMLYSAGWKDQRSTESYASMIINVYFTPWLHDIALIVYCITRIYIFNSHKGEMVQWSKWVYMSVFKPLMFQTADWFEKTVPCVIKPMWLCM